MIRSRALTSARTSIVAIFFFGTLIFVSGNDPTCWIDGFTFELCCAGASGGNKFCWDAVFTFDRCCGTHVGALAHLNREASQPSRECASSETGSCAPGWGIGVSAFARGLPPILQGHYADAQHKGFFVCADHSATLDVKELNDDYCDCPDGSDEPGTSACAGAAFKSALPGFFCRWARDAREFTSPATSAVVRFSFVNDGVCDCCGGEDEWASGADCPESCDVDSPDPSDASGHASKALAGAKARVRYAERGAVLAGEAPYSEWDGGPDHAFLAMAEKGCLEYEEDGKHIYRVCLFDRVTYRLGRNGRDFLLGRRGAWAEAFWENGLARLDHSQMVMGDGEWCHRASVIRSTVLFFECGPEDVFVSIRELTACTFEVRIETPAACDRFIAGGPAGVDLSSAG